MTGAKKDITPIRPSLVVVFVDSGMPSQEPRLTLRSVRHVERNLARLNLVLGVNRTDLQRWSKEVSVDALGTIQIHCTAAVDGVVPHGVDNDVQLGLLSAAVLQGAPSDNTVRLSVNELLKLSGLTASARTYRQVVESLLRFQKTSYQMNECWYDQGKYRWRTVAFSIVSRFEVVDNTRDPEQVGRWRAETLLEVQLDKTLMQSVRDGYISALDLEVLGKLKQPMARNVFIALSMLRLGEDGAPTMQYSVPMMAWAVHLGLHGQRPDKVLRTLAPVHAEMINCGYLVAAEYEGRGQNRAVHYRFAQAAVRKADPQAVALLTAHGVSGGRALSLAQAHPVAAIEQAVHTLTALQASPYRKKVQNKAGLLIDMLEHPENYVAASAPAARPVSRAPVEEAPPAVERDERTALTALKRCFDDTPQAREVRDQAVQLYLQGRASVMNLVTLTRTASLEEARTLLATWADSPNA